jgi:SAM-dependent methyltransferase
MKGSFLLGMQHRVTNSADRAKILLRGEADIAFRRRAVTVVDYLDPRPEDRILDAGCGLGFYLALLSRVCESSLVGVEISAERLAAAANDPTVRAQFHVGDVTRLPFADNSFDKMILSEVLEHLPDERAALIEAWRVLRPGGILAITVPHNYVRERLGLGHFQSGVLSGIWTDHRRLYTCESLTALVEGSGLSVTDVHLETRHSFPFAHHAVYAAGKFAVDHGLVRDSEGLPVTRWSLWGERRSALFDLALRVFTAPDRYNKPRYESGPAVGVCLRALKPADGGVRLKDGQTNPRSTA